jgi:hypothetical protein
MLLRFLYQNSNSQAKAEIAYHLAPSSTVLPQPTQQDYFEQAFEHPPVVHMTCLIPAFELPGFLHSRGSTPFTFYQPWIVEFE